MDLLEQTSFHSATALLAGVGVLQALAAVTHRDVGNMLGAAVCAIAALHYAWMRDTANRMWYRYSDWYITTLLMILEFFVLAKAQHRVPKLVGCCVLCWAMLSCGLAARLRNEPRWFVLGCAFGFGLLALFLHSVLPTLPRERCAVVLGFAALWCLYPFAHAAQSELAFNVLDMLSKGVFGVAVALLVHFDGK